ncbi:MAG TPA: hypothetical protein VFL57_07330 [Bryobacteraceae bacterium]|nr:hypothetical protein [Bryobacteraceae bacterium]
MQNLNRYDDDRCTSLRWKGMFIDTVWDPSAQQGSDHIYWCQKTQSCLGPDGQAVDKYECHDGRGCYKPL